MTNSTNPGTSGQKTKVAVLGGGPAALAAVFELTSPDNPKHDDYEVTVYQLGWRLGGKGASGRNMQPGYGHRIQEHGIHLLMGFYENAFRMMRACYAARPPGSAFATWKDAFKPQDFIVLMEKYKGDWYKWPIHTPTNSEEPGSGGLLPAPIALLETFVEWPFALLKSLVDARDAAIIERGGLHALVVRQRRILFGWLGHPLTRAKRKLEAALKHAVSHRASDDDRGRELLRAARWFGRAVSRELDARGLDKGISRVLHHLQQLAWSIVKRDIDHVAVRQFWVMFNFSVGNLRGVLEDDLILNGLNSVNDQDYREWLEPRLVKDGEDGRLTIDSPFGWFIYDAGFAYRDGDERRPSFEAGNAIRILVRLFLTFKGTLAFKMQAGMGDVIFTPLYQVLLDRGVKFKFFHRVLDITPNASGDLVESITFEHQARLDPPRTEYEPLVNVKNLPCWPAEPRYDQLHPDDRHLTAEHFESYALPDPAREVTIHRGDGPDEFNLVILGISAAALKCVAPKIIAVKPKWRQMLDALGTVRTQAFQLWMTPTLKELGWNLHTSPPPAVGDYRETLASSIYSDMTDVIDRETWGADGPKDIAYFCGALRNEPGDAANWCQQQSGSAAAKANGLDFTQRLTEPLWPKAVDANGQFKWELLFDARNPQGTGPNRFDSQFWIGTPNPSDRYVLTLVDSSRHRLRAGDSELDNLYLAGDWIDSTFNVGCVEASVMAGLSTSNAICGYPELKDIVGWNFGEP